MFRWVIQQQLARSPRPRIKGKRGQVPRWVVKSWIKKVKKKGIRSIICLLEDRELEMYYQNLPEGLIAHYQSKGLNVAHIKIPNVRRPLRRKHQKELWKAYKGLKKPILIHCSAGRMRTGKSVKYIKSRLSQQKREPVQ
jgi:protein tyrosine phosphatase (PTP) superfamily phosphohydrolase (DUF442 family)